MAAGIPARRSSAPATNFLRSAPESSASSSITWTSAAKATTTTITTRTNTATPPMANEQRPELYILGINVYHGDVSAVLIRDGQLIAALEEERFRRVKHFAGFPAIAIRRCLEIGGIEGKQLDAIAVGRNPKANLLRKAAFVLSHRPAQALLRDRVHNLRKFQDLKTPLADALSVTVDKLPKI